MAVMLTIVNKSSYFHCGLFCAIKTIKFIRSRCRQFHVSFDKLRYWTKHLWIAWSSCRKKFNLSVEIHSARSFMSRISQCITQHQEMVKNKALPTTIGSLILGTFYESCWALFGDHYCAVIVLINTFLEYGHRSSSKDQTFKFPVSEPTEKALKTNWTSNSLTSPRGGSAHHEREQWGGAESEPVKRVLTRPLPLSSW
jgi:hypothetical protein